MALARLRVKKGDTLYLTEAPDDACRFTPHDPDFARQMELAETPVKAERVDPRRGAGELVRRSRLTTLRSRHARLAAVTEVRLCQR